MGSSHPYSISTHTWTTQISSNGRGETISDKRIALLVNQGIGYIFSCIIVVSLNIVTASSGITVMLLVVFMCTLQLSFL